MHTYVRRGIVALVLLGATSAIPSTGAAQEAVPAEEAPTEEAPTEEAPTEEAPRDEAPAEEAPAEQATADEAPRQEVPAEEPEPASNAAPAAETAAHHWLAVQIGFSHWFGATFGAPIGTFTPALAVSVIPLDWLEVQLAYAVSVVELALPDMNTSHVGFLTAALMLRRELRIDSERLVLGGGILGGIAHTRGGVRGALGIAIVVRYLVELGAGVTLGPFVDLRAVIYEIAENPSPLIDMVDGQLRFGNSDAHVQLGVAVGF